MATYDEITNRIHGVYHRLRLTLNGTVLDDIPNNVEFNNTANDSSGLEIGTTYCSQITFDIENSSKDLRDLELLIEDGVRDSDGTYVYKKLGYFQVNSVKSDRGVYSYVCYDRMAYVFSGQYTTSLTFPTTDKAIIEEICQKCGVTLIGSLTAHTVSDVPIGTNRSVLTYMLQLQGKNAVFNADGNLEIKWYTQTDYSIDDSRIYSDGEADTASPFTVGYVKNTRTVKKTVTKEEDQTDYDDNGNEITKKVSYVEETSEEETYTAGTGLQGVSFNNPYMTQEIVNELYDKLKTFTYTPANFYVVGDYRVRAMDIITVTTDGGKSYTVPVMTIHHSCDGGLADTVSAYGQSESESSSENESELSKAMTRYDAELAYLKTVYANTLNVNKAYIAFAEIKELHATNAVIKKLDAETVKTIYLEAEVAKFGYVTADTVEAQYARLDKANIGTGWIDSAMIGEGVVGTVQIADGSITDAKIVELTANKITAGTLSVERLEIRGTANSIVYALNDITGALQAQNVDTLNGEILTPRSITADRIVAEAITAKEIAANAITTNHILTGAVTADKIAVKAVTADKMDVIDLSAISAFIGGWALGEGYIRDLYGGKYTGLGRSGVAEAFFAGGALADGSDGVFRVGHDGSLYASNATISGNITADTFKLTKGDYIFWVDETPYTLGLCIGVIEYVENSMGGINPALKCGISIDGESINVAGKMFVPAGVTVGTTSIQSGTINVNGGATIKDGELTLSKSSSGYGYIYFGPQKCAIYDNDGSGSIKIRYKASADAEDWSYTNVAYIMSTLSSKLPKENPTATGTMNANLRYLQNNGASRCVAISGDSYAFGPYTAKAAAKNDNSINLGWSDNRWTKVYAASSSISTSDEREKTIIGNLDQYKPLFMELKPIAFRWNRPDEDDIFGIHFGLGAQTTEISMNKLGITPDLAFLQHDYFEPDRNGRTDRYGISYEEIQILTMAVVQDHETEIRKLKEKIADLESQIEKISA